jgi:uncharacterized membrane protein
MNPPLLIFFRWLHVASACIAVGGVFFIRVVFPVGLKALDDQAAKTMFLRTRRAFKMVIHSCILLLIISGSFNAWVNWPAYAAAGHEVADPVFGVHLLLALIIFAIALWLLAGAEPPPNHRNWAAVNVVLMLLAIAAASTLKYVREHPNKPAPTPTLIITPVPR